MGLTHGEAKALLSPKARHKLRVFLEVYLVNGPQIRRLNRIFRGKDKATNVLAFPSDGFPGPDTQLHFLGEIYLCPNYIRRHGEDTRRLAIHGFLHLLGYTHKKRSDRIKMEDLEDKILVWVS
jgi:probable rRNA maturation factor